MNQGPVASYGEPQQATARFRPAGIFRLRLRAVWQPIHLATALLWREQFGGELTMATHDAALVLAARAHGIPVVGFSTV
jgi:hypothetical protein